MVFISTGRILRGIGGIYTVSVFKSNNNYPLEGHEVFCRARGNFRHDGIKPLVGDIVELTYGEDSFSAECGSVTPKDDGRGILISKICERKNALIRPPLANIDYMFVVMASSSPSPNPEITDKFISILEYNDIEPVIIIGKDELSPDTAKKISDIYTNAGFSVFSVSCRNNTGIDEVKQFIYHGLTSKIAAFGGASGVGKSTLMNTLYPDLVLETNDVSRKTERGRHTTRHVELYPIPANGGSGYIADTPGFSMLDFDRFDFFDKDDLPDTFREFRDLLPYCRYTDCTHTKEEGCAVVDAVKSGKISKSRHDSFISIYDVLKTKKFWDK